MPPNGGELQCGDLRRFAGRIFQRATRLCNTVSANGTTMRISLCKRLDQRGCEGFYCGATCNADVLLLELMKGGNESFPSSLRIASTTQLRAGQEDLCGAYERVAGW